MSAREKLLDRLWWVVPSSDDAGAKQAARDMLDDVLREHAHELAEQIREAAKGIPPHGLCPQVSTAYGAANLIDPKGGR